VGTEGDWRRIGGTREGRSSRNYLPQRALGRVTASPTPGRQRLCFYPKLRGLGKRAFGRARRTITTFVPDFYKVKNIPVNYAVRFSPKGKDKGKVKGQLSSPVTDQ
jgi:hypothetical protein